jgi:hypothetical protein
MEPPTMSSRMSVFDATTTRDNELPQDCKTTAHRHPACDLCKIDRDVTTRARYDAKTTRGPWAFMCDTCFSMYGIGLGLGRGQRLISVV